MNFRDIERLVGYIKTLTGDLQPHLHIGIMGLDNCICQFRIKTNVPLYKIMDKYAEIIGKPRNTIRFRLDGSAVNQESTPASIPLREGDNIEVYIQQTGGNDEQCTSKIEETTSGSSFDNSTNSFIGYHSQQIKNSPVPQSFHTCY